MPKQYKEERISMTKEDMIDLVVKGYDDVRTVMKESHSSGVIRLPSRFIGQKFRVILIPQSNIDEQELNELQNIKI